MKNKQTLMAGTAIVGAVALTGLSVMAQQQSDETPEMWENCLIKLNRPGNLKDC